MKFILFFFFLGFASPIFAFHGEKCLVTIDEIGAPIINGKHSKIDGLLLPYQLSQSFAFRDELNEVLRQNRRCMISNRPPDHFFHPYVKLSQETNKKLLARGLAVLYDFPDSQDSTNYKEIEYRAAKQKIGLWANDVQFIQDFDPDQDKIDNNIGDFPKVMLIHSRIRNVSKLRGFLYLNLGNFRTKETSLNIRITSRLARELKLYNRSLVGEKVILRGYIQENRVISIDSENNISFP